MAMMEKRVWGSLEGDLVMAISEFLPWCPLTPKGLLDLTFVDKQTRKALERWTGECKAALW
jgi:hypothetical protein